MGDAALPVERAAAAARGTTAPGRTAPGARARSGSTRCSSPRAPSSWRRRRSGSCARTTQIARAGSGAGARAVTPSCSARGRLRQSSRCTNTNPPHVSSSSCDRGRASPRRCRPTEGRAAQRAVEVVGPAVVRAADDRAEAAGARDGSVESTSSAPRCRQTLKKAAARRRRRGRRGRARPATSTQAIAARFGADVRLAPEHVPLAAKTARARPATHAGSRRTPARRQRAFQHGAYR